MRKRGAVHAEVMASRRERPEGSEIDGTHRTERDKQENNLQQDNRAEEHSNRVENVESEDSQEFLANFLKDERSRERVGSEGSDLESPFLGFSDPERKGEGVFDPFEEASNLNWAQGRQQESDILHMGEHTSMSDQVGNSRLKA